MGNHLPLFRCHLLRHPLRAAAPSLDARLRPSTLKFPGHRRRIVAIGAKTIRSVGIGCMGSSDEAPFASCTKVLSSRKLAKVAEGTESVARRTAQQLCDSCLDASGFISSNHRRDGSLTFRDVNCTS